MNNINNLHGKKIGILGLGIENFALIQYLNYQKISCEITIFDFRSIDILKNKYKGLSRKKITWIVGQNAKKDLRIFDIIFRSPGWPSWDPDIIEAEKKRIKISSPMQLFFELSPSKQIIGVTGTKGKGTTSSLIYEMIKASGRKTRLGGNIGIAPFGFMKKISPTDWIVLELSSFQLENLKISPHIAVITNLFPEHLSAADPLNPNYHQSFADYWRAKQNIFKWQKKKDKAIINFDLKQTVSRIKHKGESFFFSSANRQADCYFINEDIVLPNMQVQASVKLPGEHNRANIAAAVMAASLAGADIKSINKAICHFHGLEHRLELVDTINGVQYYNDSFATIPEGTITALKSFDRNIVLIAGGAEKKSKFSDLAAEIKNRVNYLILLQGDATSRLVQEVQASGFPTDRISICPAMETAVEIAASKSQPGEIVLLSPACASFGMFNNYKERGKKFKDAVKSLKEKK